MGAYLSATASDIRRNGLEAIRRKAHKLLWQSASVLLYPVILALRPVLYVRFVLIQGVYLGHLALQPAYYLAERRLGRHAGRTLDIFHIRPETPANEALARVVSRSLRVWPGSAYFFRRYRRSNRGRAHTFLPTDLRPGPANPYPDMDIDGVLQRTEPEVSLLPEEQAAGWRVLAEQGVPEGARFVAFHARTGSYYRERLSVQDRATAEQAQHYRNSSFEILLPAAKSLAEQGYYALRMGAVREPAMPALHPRVLDYANGFRSPEMDIFLLANCHFLISNGSGPDGICELFRRPVVFVDYAVWGGMHSWLPHITIFRKYWLKDEKRFMTIREGFANGCEYLVTTEAFAERGIELIPNTAEEVQDAVMEMEARLAGTWVGEPEDEALQRRFWSAVGDHPLHQNVCGRIGAAYLRQNQDLIG